MLFSRLFAACPTCLYPLSTSNRRLLEGMCHLSGARSSGTTPAVAISGAVTPNVSFRAFDTDTKKWVLLAALSGCIMRASSPRYRYPEQLFLRGIQKGERP